MSIKKSDTIGSTSLELGTDQEAFGTTAKRCWFVTAKTAPAGGKGELKQWGPLTKVDAEQVYDHLVGTFEAVAKAANDFHALVVGLGEVAKSEEGVEIFVAPEQENIGRYGVGIDYGADRLLLAKCGKVRLWWRKGHTAWSGVGQQSYYPAELSLQGHKQHRFTHDLFKGGRLTKKKIMEHAEAINEAFGFDAAKHLDPKRTVIFQKKEQAA